MLHELILAAVPSGAVAAQQAVQAAPQPTSVTTDSLTGLYILVGTAVVGQLLAGIFAFIKWMGSRTVEREDEDKKAMKAELEKRRQEIEKLREDIDERFEEGDDAIKALDKSVSNIDRDVKQMSDLFKSLKTSVEGLASTNESRIDKQGEFYRAEVKSLLATLDKRFEELEYRLRADATRAMRDAQQMSATRKKS